MADNEATWLVLTDGYMLRIDDELTPGRSPATGALMGHVERLPGASDTDMAHQIAQHLGAMQGLMLHVGIDVGRLKWSCQPGDGERWTLRCQT